MATSIHYLTKTRFTHHSDHVVLKTSYSCDRQQAAGDNADCKVSYMHGSIHLTVDPSTFFFTSKRPIRIKETYAKEKSREDKKRRQGAR